MDLVVTCDRFPEPGETIFANSFSRFPGGKGANQAVAAARLGAHVRFLGKMGSDGFGDELARSMARDGVRMEGLLRVSDHPTGTALITVDASGQNKILVVSGANVALTPADIQQSRQLVLSANVVLLQLEIPVSTVEKAAAMAKDAGATVVLNPAPAQPLGDELLSVVDYLTPNEHELEQLSGHRVSGTDDLETAARRLLDKGVGAVIVTRGQEGVLFVSRERVKKIPAIRVTAVDTTAAGDTFSGVFSACLSNGDNPDEAVKTAICAASYSVTLPGAQPSMPSQSELGAFALKRGIEM
jgi:ribokinase